MNIKDVVAKVPKTAAERCKEVLNKLPDGVVLTAEELAPKVRLEAEGLRENQHKYVPKEYRLLVKKLDKTFFGPPRNINALKAALGIGTR